MSPKRISLLLFIILSLAAAILFVLGNSFMGPTETSVVDPTPSPEIASAARKEATPPVNLQELFQSLQNPPPLTPEQIGDDKAIEKAQVDAALWQLNASDATQRIVGAEQLGAYPTQEAEVALTQALTSDSQAEVRAAAAQSLRYVKKPSSATVAVLLGVLEDQDEHVRLQALWTLQGFLVGSQNGSERQTSILSGLKAASTSPAVPKDTRKVIHDILEEQPGTTTAP